jgi:tRNA (mo5U34)-methyltransferase
MDLRERVRQITWYHTLELAPGVVTPGVFDLRPWVKRYGLPDRLDGMRVLDVGSWDGFWAFEMERRGADEVIALDLDDEADLDWPPRRRPTEYRGLLGGDGFNLAKSTLGSSVQRIVSSIHDADPAELGTFDLVLCGVVLIHMRDQLGALERIARLCRGTFISAEAYDPWLSALPVPASRYFADRDSSVVFWMPSARTWRRMLWTAGFDDVRQHARVKIASTQGWSVRHVIHHAAASTISGRSLPTRRSSTSLQP